MAYPEMDLDASGAWGPQKPVGLAVHTPAEVQDISIPEFCIEWLGVSEPSNNFYTESHMVATVVFVTSQSFNGKRFRAPQGR